MLLPAACLLSSKTCDCQAGGKQSEDYDSGLSFSCYPNSQFHLATCATVSFHLPCLKKKEKLILVTLLELLFNNKLIIISYYSVTWPEMSLSHNYSLTV